MGMTMKGTFKKRQRAAFNEINVTPMVDIMLVLLVIFMVTAPLLTVGVPVDLPKTDAARLNDQVEPLTISVDASGKVYLQETALELPMLTERLIAITGHNPDAKIYVRGDRNLNYGRIMEIMGTIAAAGFRKVSLIAEIAMPQATGKQQDQKQNTSPAPPAVKAQKQPSVQAKKAPDQPQKTPTKAARTP